MPLLQVGADQFLLAAEAIVKRGFGHPGALDHAVDADQVESLFIEQLVGGGEQALPCRASIVGWRFCNHRFDFNRQVCMIQRTDRSVYHYPGTSIPHDIAFSLCQWHASY